MIKPTQEEIRKLRKMLTDKDEWMRKNAAWVFGNNGTHAKEVLPALIGALGDEDPYVRMWSAKALGELGSDAKDAIPKLQELAEDDPFKDQFILQEFPVRYFAREAIDQILDKP